MRISIKPIKKHWLLLVYAAFAFLLGGIIFQEVKGLQFSSDVDFTGGKYEKIPAGAQKELSFRQKTNYLVSIHIPFTCKEEIAADSFNVQFPSKNGGKNSLFSKRVDSHGGDSYFLILSFPEPADVSSVSLECDKDISYVFRSSGETQSKQYGIPVKFQFLFLIAYAFMAAFAYLFFWGVNKFLKNLAAKYFFYAVFLGCACIAIYPAFNIPDERVHFNTAIYYANVLCRIQKYSPDVTHANILFRECDNRIYPEEIADKKEFTRDTSEFWQIKDLKRYYSFAFPNVLKPAKNTGMVNVEKECIEAKRTVFFIPHILGAIFFRALNVNQYILYYGTCFFSLMWCALIVAAALFKTKCKNILILFLALNPALLQQMCHFTYDGTIYTLALSFVLYFASYYKTGKKSDLALSTLCWILLYPAKSHLYVPLGLVYLLLFKKQLRAFYSKKRLFYFSLASLAAAAVFVSVHNLGEPAFHMRGNEIATKIVFLRTRAFAFSHPLTTLFMALTTIFDSAQHYLLQGLGITLGVRNLTINMFLVLAYVTMLYFVTSDSSNFELGKQERIAFLFAACFIVLAVIVGMYVSHGDNGHSITGIQGRYFIPTLPLFFIAFSSLRRKNSGTQKSYEVLQLAIPLYAFLAFINVFEIIMTA